MTDVLPEWTEKPEKRGLDPLGIQYSGIVLYQSLLPGISNVTLRVRYYSYYCWVSDTYGRRATSDPEDWQRWLRRAEALYALIAAHDGSETGVGGVEWAFGQLGEHGPEIDFTAAADPKETVRYLGQTIFAGAYFTQMAEVGLFGLNQHGIPVRTDDLGRAAAECFRSSIGAECEQLLTNKITTAIVTPSELERLRVILPSAAKASEDERPFLQNLLFARVDTAGESDHRRRDTLRLVLETAESLGRRPTPEDVRWQLFNAAMARKGDDEETRARWEAYQCQELMQVAAATLLSWALAMMNEAEGGISMADLRNQIRARLTEVAPLEAMMTWAELVQSRDERNYPYREVWSRLTGRRGAPELRAWDALTLVAALVRRLDGRPDLMSIVRSVFSTHTQARSVATELNWLATRAATAISELFADYIVERIVRRHSWVAMQKLRRQRDYTFLFEVRDGRLFPLKDYQPVATTPRLGPAIQFLADLNLIDQSGLTVNGRALMEADR